MSAEFFLDTSILVYSFDDTVSVKRDNACDLIARALWQGNGVISWQVVREFLNVALHKWEKPMTPGDANLFLNSTLEPLCAIYPSPTLWCAALSLQMESGYRFYDSLIVAAALQCGARILYSEDLQHGRTFGELEIRNPFAEA